MPRLEPGDTPEPFTLTDDSGSACNLTDYRGSKVVVYFYPAAMTPGCTTEACDFRDSLSALQTAGIQVVGISPDPVDKLQQFREKEGLNFPLLSDPGAVVMKKWGAYGEKNNYGKRTEGVIRSSVVLDESGTVQLAQYNVKATGHVARLRAKLGIE